MLDEIAAAKTKFNDELRRMSNAQRKLLDEQANLHIDSDTLTSLSRPQALCSLPHPVCADCVCMAPRAVANIYAHALAQVTKIENKYVDACNTAISAAISESEARMSVEMAAVAEAAHAELEAAAKKAHAETVQVAVAAREETKAVRTQLEVRGCGKNLSTLQPYMLMHMYLPRAALQ